MTGGAAFDGAAFDSRPERDAVNSEGVCVCKRKLVSDEPGGRSKNTKQIERGATT